VVSDGKNGPGVIKKREVWRKGAYSRKGEWERGGEEGKRNVE